MLDSKGEGDMATDWMWQDLCSVSDPVSLLSWKNSPTYYTSDPLEDCVSHYKHLNRFLTLSKISFYKENSQAWQTTLQPRFPHRCSELTGERAHAVRSERGLLIQWPCSVSWPLQGWVVECSRQGLFFFRVTKCSIEISKQRNLFWQKWWGSRKSSSLKSGWARSVESTFKIILSIFVEKYYIIIFAIT